MLSNLELGYIEYYTKNAQRKVDELTHLYGFRILGTSHGNDSRSTALVQESIVLVISEPLNGGKQISTIQDFIKNQGEGFGNIAFLVENPVDVTRDVVARGAARGPFFNSILAFGRTIHTFISREELLIRFQELAIPLSRSNGTCVNAIDHIFISPGDQFDRICSFYTEILGMSNTATEHVEFYRDSLEIANLQSSTDSVTIKMMETITDFSSYWEGNYIKNHGFPLIHHIAFRTNNIISTTRCLKDQGVRFLPVPHNYYRMVRDYTICPRYSIDELEELNVMVDEDTRGQFYQSFTIFDSSTNEFFFRFLERIDGKDIDTQAI